MKHQPVICAGWRSLKPVRTLTSTSFARRRADDRFSAALTDPAAEVDDNDDTHPLMRLAFEIRGREVEGSVETLHDIRVKLSPIFAVTICS